MPIEDQQGEIMPEAKRGMKASETPEAHAMRSQVGEILQAAMDALPEVYRSVFVFREVEQLNTIETAECLGLSEEAVKTRLHRARALLRRELQTRVGPAVAHTYSFHGSPLRSDCRPCSRANRRLMDSILRARCRSCHDLRIHRKLLVIAPPNLLVFREPLDQPHPAAPIQVEPFGSHSSGDTSVCSKTSFAPGLRRARNTPQEIVSVVSASTFAH